MKNYRKPRYNHDQIVTYNYLKRIRYGKIEQYKPKHKKSQIGNLAGYVREKKCINCKKPTIKFNRCKLCYYKSKGWNISHLLGNRKQDSQLTPSAQMKELENILTDSAERFSSDGGGEFKFPTSVTEKVKH